MARGATATQDATQGEVTHPALAAAVLPSTCTDSLAVLTGRTQP